MEAIQSLLEGQVWFNLFTAIVTAASIIAAATPTPKEDSILSKVYKVIDFLAVNIGKAKDKGEQ